MRMVDLIAKKRDGKELTKEEISFIVEGYTSGDIPDYQMSAFTMAVFFQGMTANEQAELTMSMVQSGDTIDLSAIEGVKVDKHSTGGVGDTTTLILAPLVAAVGVPVAKMSGRGLGHTGGTIDKLEAVKGFHVEIDKKEFIELVNKNKVAVVGQSGNLTPADKKIYALRDVTATVNSLPLIAASIMSKKIAAGADAIVLDVKTGAGAFMKNLEDAKALAQSMVNIGNNVGRQTMAVISDMSQPLGFAIGNALEVEEAIDTLKGKGPKDLEELCLVLGSYMVYLANKASSLEEARRMLQEVIGNGKALESFKTFLAAQGGDPSVVDDVAKLPQAAHKIEVKAEKDGYVSEIVADEMGTEEMCRGGGRARKDSEINHDVSIMMRKKERKKKKKGESLVTIYSNKEDVQEVKEHILKNISVSSEKVDAPSLIYDTVQKSN